MTLSPRILVVDDEPGTTRVLASVLDDAGYRVDVATSGRAALELLDAGDYELVLLDFFMPGIDGAETLRAMRRNRDLAKVRVVMMSGIVESMVRRKCRLEFSAFLRKPFTLDELLETVSRALG